jgi:hypothetical protein
VEDKEEQSGKEGTRVRTGLAGVFACLCVYLGVTPPGCPRVPAPSISGALVPAASSPPGPVSLANGRMARQRDSIVDNKVDEKRAGGCIPWHKENLATGEPTTTVSTGYCVPRQRCSQPRRLGVECDLRGVPCTFIWSFMPEITGAISTRADPGHVQAPQPISCTKEVPPLEPSMLL